jgi:hypothetical protein
MATQSLLRSVDRISVTGLNIVVVAGSVGEPAGVAPVVGNTSTPFWKLGRERRGIIVVTNGRDVLADFDIASGRYRSPF